MKYNDIHVFVDVFLKFESSNVATSFPNRVLVRRATLLLDQCQELLGGANGLLDVLYLKA